MGKSIWTNEAGTFIAQMVDFFLARCSERSTLTELKAMALDYRTWREAHKLFSRIRDKTLKADASADRLLQAQYSFEEICAKTLYNLADHHEGFSAAYLPPFDSDSPLWVFPMAIGFADALGLKGLQFGNCTWTMVRDAS